MELRILVVEDSPTQAQHLRLVLDDAGYQVEVAVNGREGLERAVAAPPDLIISDIVMPDMDGFAFCAAAKAHEATRRIPFVLLTEQRDVRDIVIGLDRGADNFVPKPVDDEELVKLVRLILERHLTRQEDGDRPGALSAEGPSPGATILVVDDEPALRALIEDYLVLAGYRVVTADSAEHALAIVHGDLPDLVLTDVNLGGMSGIELCARLKANPRFQFIPVIILTAVADLQARLLGLSAGAEISSRSPWTLPSSTRGCDRSCGSSGCRTSWKRGRACSSRCWAGMSPRTWRRRSSAIRASTSVSAA